jgi:hypothetical protein
MTRVELAKLIEEHEKDEPFTMPFFLLGCLRDMMKRQGLRKVTEESDDFKARLKLYGPATGAVASRPPEDSSGTG